jgi:hypothetical protein
MRLFVLLTFLCATTAAFAQEQEQFMNQTTRDRINYTTVAIPITNSLFTIKGPAGKLLGDPHLDTTWQAGNVKFYNRLGVSLTNDSLAGVPVRLDLSTNEVEIRAGAKDIRAVKASAVRYIVMNTATGTPSRFINVMEYKGDAEKLAGFFEQITAGKLQLLQHPSVYIRRANYNVAMNTGTKDDELVKKMDWYIAQNTKATKFSPGKKALLDVMADKKDQVEAFLKKEKPDLKTRSGMAALVTYYNSL